MRWSDIDLDAATVRIERSVSATKQDGVFIKTTKTDRFRLVSLTAQAVASLADHLERAHEAAETTRTSTTLDIYWAWVPARDRDAADHLQGVLGG